MNKPISIRIPEELDLKLSEIAKETERTKSFHILKAIEAYLAELADLQVALDRLHDTTDPTVSLEKMRILLRASVFRILSAAELAAIPFPMIIYCAML